MKGPPRIVFACLCILMFIGISVGLGDRHLPETTLVHVESPPAPPPPPKTRAQIASEAYAIEAQARALAGRKTDQNLDGTGGSATSQTATDTTVADFNAGSGVNTASLDGQIQLSYLTNDTFSVADSDGNTAQWLAKSAGDGTGDCEYTRIAGGVFQGAWTPAGTLRKWCGLVSRATTSGDFDTSVKFIWKDASGAEPQPYMCIQDTQSTGVGNGITCEGTNANGVWYRHVPGLGFGAFKIVNGVSSAIGTATQVMTCEAIDVPCWFRITRVGQTFTFYYSINGSSWTLDEQADLTASSIPSKLFVHFGLGFNGVNGNRGEMWFDDFLITPPVIPSFAIFTSAARSFSEWTALLVKGTWTQINGPIIQFRHANNSDMSGASGWVSMTNNSDVSAQNYRAGFFQYRVNFTSLSQVLYDFTFHYLSQSSGDSPSKDIPTKVAVNSAWRHQSVVVSKIIYVNLSSPGTLTLWVNNSVVNFTNYITSAKGFQPTISVSSGGTYTVYLRIANSTVKNVGNITWPVGPAPYNLGTNVRVLLDNVTLDTFNQAMPSYNQGTSCTIGIEICNFQLHDSTMHEYNKADLSYAALQFVSSIIRVKASNPTPRATGTIALATFARSNFFEGGFNQLVFEDAAQGSGIRTEYGNWSNNYVANSTHTAFGVYGVSPGDFFAPSLSGGYYFTVYRNYINNSRYIQIQSGGNMSDLRVIGNYQQGVSPSFSEAMGFNWRTHNTTVKGNYIWNMNSTNNRGIVISDFSYDFLVEDNVIFDVGVYHIEIGTPGLKYKNQTGVDTSDYSWKGMNRTIRNNYFAGAWHNPVFVLEGGYVQAYNNTITEVGPTYKDFWVYDSWNSVPPREASYAWLDWHGGYANLSNVKWTPLSTYHESEVWIRYFADSRVTVVANAVANNSITVQSAHPYWGRVLPCTDANVQPVSAFVVYGGKLCFNAVDVTSIAFVGTQTQTISAPFTFYNRTLTQSMNPRFGIVHSWTQTDYGSVYDSTSGISFRVEQGGAFSVTAGHSYSITFGDVITDLGPIIAMVLAIGAFVLVIGMIMGGFLIFTRRRERER